MLPTRRLLNLVYHHWVRGASADTVAEVDDMLIAAGTLDLTARPEPVAKHTPGTAPRHIRPPSWWKGNRAAFDNSVAAASQLGEPAAKGITPARRAAPVIGSRRTPAVAG